MFDKVDTLLRHAVVLQYYHTPDVSLKAVVWFAIEPWKLLVSG